ncbi:MAG: hypothetical protein M5U26_05755 [Planctomycetota bacterium]|nr:hypothetical protein [Planctomycetota bacterium]
MTMWPFTERIKTPEGEPYLTRYTLLHLPGLRVYLHHLHRADEDRHLHDHPWNFTSLVLKGGYVEETLAGSREHRPGAVIRHRAEDVHRVASLPKGSAWTLVFCGRKRRSWGFLVEQNWVDSSAYLRDAKGTAGARP